MCTYALSHLSRDEIVQHACNILRQDQTLKIEVNRPRSHAIYLKQGEFIMDELQRAQCLSLVTTHINPEMRYFFLTGDRMTRYYIDEMTLNQIAFKVAQSFKKVVWTTITGVIDDETDTELALTHLIPAAIFQEDLSLSIQESSWIIKLNKGKDTEDRKVAL